MPALGLLFLLIGSALAPEVEAAPRRASRVRVSDHGVVVERAGDLDTVDTHVSAGGDTGTDDGGWIDVNDRGDALVRVFGDIHVPRGKRVSDDVVAVFGSVDVEGEVEGDVVAVMGSVRVRDGAIVHGQAVSVGGAVNQEEGATINGETVSVGFFPISWGIPGLPLTLGAIAAGWIAAVFAGWIFALTFPGRLVRVAATASRRAGASLLLGLVSMPGFVALMMLLLVTVVGIPLAVLLPFAYILLVYGGQLAATYVLGCKLVRRPLGGPGLLWPIVAGSLLVAAFFGIGAVLFVVPGVMRPFGLFSALLGTLLVLGLAAIGTGAFLLSKLGSEPRDVTWGEAPVPATAAVPVPPTTV